MTFKKMIGVVGVVGTLAACGGGGSQTPIVAQTAALTSANQNIAAQDTASASYLPMVGAQTLTGAQVTDESVLFSLARAQLDKLPTYLAKAKANGTLIGAVQSETMACSFGGTVTASVTDADNNGVVSAGDSVTIAGNNCIEPEGTLTGSLSFAVNNLTGTFGSSSYSASMTMNFNGFSVTSSQFSANANGALTVSITANGMNTGGLTVSATSLSVAGTYAGVTRSRTLSNYSATSTRSPNLTYGYTTSYTMSGTLTSSALSSQAISFTTSTPFVSRPSDYYPSSGVMVITGAANSKVKLTALSATQVKQELDANGDDIYEASTTVAWNTLM